MRLWGFKPAAADDRCRLIAAPCGTRMIVQGGPGTGKTELACVRAAQLIQQQGLAPSGLLIISFTRIAVRAIAERIAAHLGHTGHGVPIVTLDALAAQLSPEAIEDQDHDQQIRHIIPLLPGHPRLRGLSHVMVDEAHDVVGPRADMIEHLIRHLPHQCGVTVLADDAQSIYDFADRSRWPQPPLPARLRGHGMAQHQLHVQHRTHVPALVKMVEEARAIVLHPRTPPHDRLPKLLQRLRRAVPVLPHMPPAAQLDDQTLLLFRHGAQALLAAHELVQQGHSYRLRLSGLPPALPAWIALTLADVETPAVTAARFRRQWRENVAETHHAVLDGQDAWSRLHRVAPLGADVDMARLRAVLRQASPPLDLCEPQMGTWGPVVGTIHASKGREAERVVLALPDPGSPSPSEEDSRVWFVGATRARQSLSLVVSPTTEARFLPSGRSYFPTLSLLELGLPGDLAAPGLVGCATFATAQQARQAQQLLARMPPGSAQLPGDSNLGIMFENQVVARLSSTIFHDLDDLGGGGVPCPVPVIGLRSLVFDPDPQCPLHGPWSASGFALAPMVAGLSPIRMKE